MFQQLDPEQGSDVGLAQLSLNRYAKLEAAARFVFDSMEKGSKPGYLPGGKCPGGQERPGGRAIARVLVPPAYSAVWTKPCNACVFSLHYLSVPVGPFTVPKHCLVFSTVLGCQ